MHLLFHCLGDNTTCPGRNRFGIVYAHTSNFQSRGINALGCEPCPDSLGTPKRNAKIDGPTTGPVAPTCEADAQVGMVTQQFADSLQLVGFARTKVRSCPISSTILSKAKS